MSDKPAAVNSASDQCTVNNIMRRAYRVLSDAEKAQMSAIKDKGAEFLELLHIVGGNPGVGRQASRKLSIAQTKIDEAVNGGRCVRRWWRAC